VDLKQDIPRIIPGIFRARAH